MSDYEVKPMPKEVRKRTKIHGASEQLMNDINAAIEAGISYGTYIGRKKSRAEELKYSLKRKKADALKLSEK